MHTLLKKALLAAALFFLEIQAMEYEPQFENDLVCVSKVKIMAGEEIGLHRDTHPQVVVALEGGVITRLEANGTTTDVHFPTAVPVFRDSDPPDELHKSINQGASPIELVIIQLKTL